MGILLAQFAKEETKAPRVLIARLTYIAWESQAPTPVSLCLHVSSLTLKVIIIDSLSGLL